MRDAGEKFKELREEKWRAVAGELHNEDCHQFIRAYTAGGITGRVVTEEGCTLSPGGECEGSAFGSVCLSGCVTQKLNCSD